MALVKTKNLRKKKLDGICTKIAMFMMQETYTDEKDAQSLLVEAIQLLNKASDILVINDEKTQGDILDQG